MGGAHLAQAAGQEGGPAPGVVGTLAWGACGAGLHYPPPRAGEPRARIPDWPRGSFCLRLDFEYPENPGPMASKGPALPGWRCYCQRHPITRLETARMPDKQTLQRLNSEDDDPARTECDILLAEKVTYHICGHITEMV